MPWTPNGVYYEDPDYLKNTNGTGIGTPPSPVAAPFQPSTGTGPMAAATTAGTNSNGFATPDYGFGPSHPQVSPGQIDPQDSDGRAVQPPYLGVDQATRNAFMPEVFTAPYYNAAGVAGNLGTMMTEGVAPASASFMQGQFDPNLNTFEQSFLGAGLNNASRLLEQGMLRQESQFEETPYHSGLAKAQGDVMNQYANDLTSIASQMGMQRQANATQMSQFPFTYGLQASQVAPTMAERMFNMYNTAYQQPLQLPETTYSQIPVPSPVISQSTGGGKG